MRDGTSLGVLRPRRRVLDFACWLFGHELDTYRNDIDAEVCECGKRMRTMTLRAAIISLPGELRKRRWRL